MTIKLLLTANQKLFLTQISSDYESAIKINRKNVKKENSFFSACSGLVPMSMTVKTWKTTTTTMIPVSTTGTKTTKLFWPLTREHSPMGGCMAELLLDWFGFDQTSKTLVQATKAKELITNKINTRSDVQLYFPLC